MTKMRCPVCDGNGTRFVAPAGVNTFKCRIEQLARILRKVKCWDCGGTGEKESDQ